MQRMEKGFQKLFRGGSHEKLLPPAFMRGVPAGRGESEYLRSKYSESPLFDEKRAGPLRPDGSGLCPNPPGHLPYK